MPTPQEFAARIKSIYPDYAGIDDGELVSRILAKYPEYRTAVTFASPKEQFQTIQRGIHALNLSKGALPGDKAPLAPSTLDTYFEWGKQNIADTGSFLGDAASRTASNIGGMIAHPIDTLRVVGQSADPEAHARRAVAEAKHGNYGTAALEGLGAIGGPVTSSLVDPVKQLGAEAKGTLSGDREQAANLLGDVGTMAVLDRVPKAASAAAKTAGVVGPRAIAALGDTIPPRIMNTVVSTGTKYFKFGANPGEALVGIKPDILTGTDGFKGPLQAKINMLARQADAVLNSGAANTKMIDVIEPLESEIAAARQVATDTGNEAMLARLDKLEEAQRGLIVKATNSRYATPSEAQLIKRRIGDLVRWSADPIEGSVNQVLQDVYRAIDKRIDAAVPAVKTLNERLANAITARKVVDHAADLGLKSDPFKLRNLLSSQYVKSRVAAGLRSAFGQADAPLPETTPSPIYQPPAAQLALPPAREPLALPPAPTEFMITRPHVPDAEGLVFREPYPTDMGSQRRDFTGPLTRGAGQPWERSEISEWPTDPTKRDENDALIMQRRDPKTGRALKYPRPKTMPSELLPPHFAEARKIAWGSPVSGKLGAKGDAHGVYGMAFSTADRNAQMAEQRLHGATDATWRNTAMIAASDVDAPETAAHEMNHAVWLRDLPEAQKQEFRQMVADGVGRVRQAGGDALAAARKERVPSAVISYALKLKDPEHIYGESFAELGGQYVMNPTAFRATYPEWYDYFRRIYGRREYRGGRVLDPPRDDAAR